MSLPSGLLPVAAFALTVGIATPTALGAHWFHRAGGARFGAGLRAALIEAAGFYLVGTVAVGAIAGDASLLPVAATLLVAGIGAVLSLALVPLAVGRLLVRRARGVDPETALRFATYGWPVAMLAAFGVFVAPGGPARGHLLHLEGPTVCLAGFCGLDSHLVAALGLEAVVALVGPGTVGLLIHVSSSRPGRETRASE